ncbi:MAG: CoA pyrophosphatase [Anaerolineales bacterium]
MSQLLPSLSVNRIRALLAARAAGHPLFPLSESSDTQPPKPAAVLVPLLQQKNAWHLLFILRAQVEGDMHSAQVAFPGGRLEPGETLAEQTALREAHEEINLKPEGVQLLGRLEDFITISNYQVTPVVGLIPWPFGIRPDPREVQHAFTIPLSWLADSANREERERITTDGHALKVIYFKQYGKELLWGITARITLYLLQALELA